MDKLYLFEAPSDLTLLGKKVNQFVTSLPFFLAFAVLSALQVTFGFTSGPWLGHCKILSCFGRHSLIYLKLSFRSLLC